VRYNRSTERSSDAVQHPLASTSDPVWASAKSPSHDATSGTGCAWPGDKGQVKEIIGTTWVNERDGVGSSTGASEGSGWWVTDPCICPDYINECCWLSKSLASAVDVLIHELGLCHDMGHVGSVLSFRP
jgi:hypothetical protein